MLASGMAVAPTCVCTPEGGLHTHAALGEATLRKRLVVVQVPHGVPYLMDGADHARCLGYERVCHDHLLEPYDRGT